MQRYGYVANNQLFADGQYSNYFVAQQTPTSHESSCNTSACSGIRIVKLKKEIVTARSVCVNKIRSLGSAEWIRLDKHITDSHFFPHSQYRDSRSPFLSNGISVRSMYRILSSLYNLDSALRHSTLSSSQP